MAEIIERCLQNHEKCHIMLFSTSKIKDESNVLGHILNNIGFLIEGTLVRAKSVVVMQPLKKPPYCKNTEG